MVEHPWRAARQIARRHAMIEAPIHVPPDLGRPPVDGEDVEVVGVRAGCQRVRPADAGAARIARPVQRAVHHRRLAADVLHDVDLAAARPSSRVDVGAEHPEGRPQSLPARDADARLEAPVRLDEQPSRLQPRGRVATHAVPTLMRGRRHCPRRDHQVTLAVQRHVLGASRVELPLLVAEAAAAGVGHPLSTVERRARRPRELVAPHGARRR